MDEGLEDFPIGVRINKATILPGGVVADVAAVVGITIGHQRDPLLLLLLRPIHDWCIVPTFFCQWIDVDD